MNDKYAKEIAKELKLIRRELEKANKPAIINTDHLSEEQISEMLNHKHQVVLQKD